VVSLVSGLLFGISPALRAARLDPARTLRAGTRILLPPTLRLRRALVTAQVALTLVLPRGGGPLRAQSQPASAASASSARSPTTSSASRSRRTSAATREMPPRSPAARARRSVAPGSQRHGGRLSR
jgi:hypothetical protein